MSRACFRLGATSYIYPTDLEANVAALGPVVDDVELVLFETDALSNLPDRPTLAALQRLADLYQLTYTVHLPLDLCPEASHPSLPLAQRVIRLTQPLQPYAIVAHLDARAPLVSGDWAKWREGSLRCLEKVGGMMGSLERLCIENIERWPYEEMLPLLDRLPISFCLDIGHLWLQGLHVPAVFASLALRTRTVHLHGIDSATGRDHSSLAHVPNSDRDAALDALSAQGFGGVLTLEVFTAQDFASSREQVLSWLAGEDRKRQEAADKIDAGADEE